MSLSSGDSNANATMAVTTLKNTCAAARRRALGVALMAATMPVRVVPMLAPITMAAATSSVTMPPATAEAVERYDKAVDAAKKAYDAALAKAAADARKDLEKVLDVETKGGRLESALAV